MTQISPLTIDLIALAVLLVGALAISYPLSRLVMGWLRRNARR